VDYRGGRGLMIAAHNGAGGSLVTHWKRSLGGVAALVPLKLPTIAGYHLP
jgi:hypothetical protein